MSSLLMLRQRFAIFNTDFAWWALLCKRLCVWQPLGECRSYGLPIGNADYRFEIDDVSRVVAKQAGNLLSLFSLIPYLYLQNNATESS